MRYIESDLTVIGGGIAGLSAALTAARHGLRVALVECRDVLGGNASSENRVHMNGAGNLLDALALLAQPEDYALSHIANKARQDLEDLCDGQILACPQYYLDGLGQDSSYGLLGVLDLLGCTHGFLLL